MEMRKIIKRVGKGGGEHPLLTVSHGQRFYLTEAAIKLLGGMPRRVAVYTDGKQVLIVSSDSDDDFTVRKDGSRALFASTVIGRALGLSPDEKRRTIRLEKVAEGLQGNINDTTERAL